VSILESSSPSTKPGQLQGDIEASGPTCYSPARFYCEVSMKLKAIGKSACLSALLIGAAGGLEPVACGDLPGNLQSFLRPVPRSYFEEGKDNFFLAFSPGYIEAPHIRYGGIGVNGSFRHALSDSWAWDAHVGVFSGGGDFRAGGRSASVAVVSVGLGTDLEYKFYTSENIFLIGHVGLYMPYTYQFVAGQQAGSPVTLDSTSTVMFGIPIGLHAAFDLGPYWRLSPFIAYIQYLGGHTSSSYQQNEQKVPSQPPSNPGFFGSTVFGADVSYMPWRLYFGAMWQRTPASRGNPPYDSFLLQFSWEF